MVINIIFLLMEFRTSLDYLATLFICIILSSKTIFASPIYRFVSFLYQESFLLLCLILSLLVCTVCELLNIQSPYWKSFYIYVHCLSIALTSSNLPYSWHVYYTFFLISTAVFISIKILYVIFPLFPHFCWFTFHSHTISYFLEDFLNDEHEYFYSLFNIEEIYLLLTLFPL